MKDWIEVFRTGTHTDSKGDTRTWTESDLDKIANSYNPANHEAPVVIGHPKDNSPAWGWVDGLKRTGKSLFAKFKNVVPEFNDLVESGMFKKRSISLYPDLSLCHIGFLGGMPPAVKGLADIKFADDENAMTIEFEETSPGQEPEKNNKGGKDMDEKIADLQVKLGEKEKALVEKDKSLGEFSEELKAAKDELAAAKQELENSKIRTRKAEHESFCEGLIKEGKLAPAKKTAIIDLMEAVHGVGEYEFSEGKKSATEVFKEFLSALPVMVEFKEVATKEKAGEGKAASTGAEFGEHVDPERLKVHNRALELVKTQKITYEAAVIQAGKE